MNGQTATPFQTCSFEQMQLRTGDRLQLELSSDAGLTHHFTTVIGYVPKLSVLVRTPSVRGTPVEIRENETVVVRAFSGRSIYAFSTKVLVACRTPFPYLHLAYPESVRANPIRSAERVRVGLRATAANPQRDPQGNPVSCTLGDLSVTGAQLECARDIGDRGDRLQVFFAFKLEPQGYEVKLNPKAEVQSVRRYRDERNGGEVHSYGVRFEGLHATESLLLQSYIHQLLLSDRSRIV
jgi:c-di-GMP-binding flagellar brake protein YcgR